MLSIRSELDEFGNETAEDNFLKMSSEHIAVEPTTTLKQDNQHKPVKIKNLPFSKKAVTLLNQDII